MDGPGTSTVDEDPHHPMYLRSQALPYQKDIHCVLCCCGVESGELMAARTYNLHDKLHKIAKTNVALLTRLQLAFDVMAGDVLYHVNCIRTQMREGEGSEQHRTCSSEKDNRDIIFEQLRREIYARTHRGQAVLVSDCWERFKELSEETNSIIPYYFLSRRSFFKEKLVQLLPNVQIIHRQSSDLEDDIIISTSLTMRDICDILTSEGGEPGDFKLPAYNEDEMIKLVHVALYLRKLILDHPAHSKSELTEENAYSAVPEGLYVFMALMHGGSDVLQTEDEEFDDKEKAAKLRRDILGVCQDLTYTISGGRIIPPKQYSLGLTVHQLSGRSKKLVNILHRERQIISYDQCLQADTALAEETLMNMDPETGTVIPKNMVHGRPVQFGDDNIDCSKESAKAGHSSGYHGTQMVAFQPGPAAEVDISKIKFSTRTLTVPEVVHKLQELHDPIIKEPPYLITEQDVDNILNRNPDNPGFKAFTQAYAKELAFNMHRQHIGRTKEVNSNWTNYNKKHSGCSDVLATSVGQMPLLNAKADEHNTINTCVERAKIIAQHLGDKYIWFVTDQAIAAPAHETKWTRGGDWDNVHFRLGGLHASNIYMAAIGDHITDSELPQIWVEAGIITEGQVDKILKGKDYKAGIRLHRITWQAVWQVIMPQFMEHVKATNGDLHTDLCTLSHDADSILPLFTRVNSSEVLDALDEFLNIKRQDKNIAFLWTYMDMVQVLLTFTRAQRDDDWVLYMYTFTLMLDLFMRWD